MTKTMRWVLGGAAAITISGAAFVAPVLASGGRMMAGVGMMHGAGSDMAAMHGAMHPLMGQMPAMHQQVMGDVGQLFGMTADELTQALAGGKTLAVLAEEKNVPIGDVRATMTKSMKNVLDQLVEAKTITAEQAGQMLGFMEQNMDACLTGSMSDIMQQMMGSGGMMSGMMGR